MIVESRKQLVAPETKITSFLRSQHINQGCIASRSSSAPDLQAFIIAQRGRLRTHQHHELAKISSTQTPEERSHLFERWPLDNAEDV